MNAVNEALVRDVVAEVLGRLGQKAGRSASGDSPAPVPKKDCGCGGNGHVTGGSLGQGRHGVFQDASEACAAAHEGFLRLKEKGVAARAKIVEIIKGLAEANANEWGRIELGETKNGRLDHKIKKMKTIKLGRGGEWTQPGGRGGDQGTPLKEYPPFGVAAATPPPTPSIPTL